MVELVAAALENHRAGRAEDADRLYRRALADDPADPTALYLYGLFNFESGRADAAVTLLERVVELRPDHAQAAGRPSSHPDRMRSTRPLRHSARERRNRPCRRLRRRLPKPRDGSAA